MKELENSKNNVGASPVSACKTRGITLIALIITIVVMLILVVVSVQIALDTGLFESAGKATKDWEEAQDKEAELGNGKVNIGGITYNSIEEYTSSISGENAEVDFEKLFETAEKHPEQTESNDIGIAEDGSIVNMDLWTYNLIGDNNEYNLGLMGTSPYMPGGYNDEDIIDGEIQGKVPMYIKEGNANEFYPVTVMNRTFSGCTNLTKPPEIPTSVTELTLTFWGCEKLIKAPDIPSHVKSMELAFAGCMSLREAPVIPNSVITMYMAFTSCTLLTEAPVIPSSVTNMHRTFDGCKSLTKAPVIPSSVTNMGSTFEGCTSLTEAPVIPSSVTDMHGTFEGCTSLTEAPVIPNSVTDMIRTFYYCTSLTGTLTINANPSVYGGCLSGAATNEGCNLVLNGSSTMLSNILGTKSDNSNISLGS